jgi:hypothetical protein
MREAELLGLASAAPVIVQGDSRLTVAMSREERAEAVRQIFHAAARPVAGPSEARELLSLMDAEAALTVDATTEALDHVGRRHDEPGGSPATSGSASRNGQSARLPYGQRDLDSPSGGDEPADSYADDVEPLFPR